MCWEDIAAQRFQDPAPRVGAARRCDVFNDTLEQRDPHRPLKPVSDGLRSERRTGSIIRTKERTHFRTGGGSTAPLPRNYRLAPELLMVVAMLAHYRDSDFTSRLVKRGLR